jgi:hypothetical protein
MVSGRLLRGSCEYLLRSDQPEIGVVEFKSYLGAEVGTQVVDDGIYKLYQKFR